MTILEMAKGIATDASRLHDKAQLSRDLVEYASLATEFNELADVLDRSLESEMLLTGVGIVVERPPIPEQAIRKLQGLTSSAGEIVERPREFADRAMRELLAWSRQSTEAARLAYQKWLQSVLPDLDRAETMGLALAEVDPTLSASIRRSVSNARVFRHDVPTAADQFESIKVAGEALRKAVDDAAPPGEIREFLEAILGDDGARLSEFTEPVQAWAKDRGLTARLRLRLSDSRDD